MHDRETFQKIARDRIKENKPSRRHFIALAVATAGALVGFPILKHRSDQILAGRELEEIVNGSNNYLEYLENDIKDYKKRLEEAEKMLSQIETATSESPQNLQEVSIYEQVLRKVTAARQIQENDFLQSQKKVTDLTKDIDTFLASQSSKDKQGLLKQWRNGEFLQRKARIEKQMQSFVVQQQATDAKFKVLIIKIEEKIKEGKEKFGNDARKMNIA